MKQRIEQLLPIISQSLALEKDLKASEQAVWHRPLVEIQRELEYIRFAAQENCSVAVFGESQMGKSLLISSMLSEPGKPYHVSCGGQQYNFKDKINPSLPGSSQEATGVITRFTLGNKEDMTPEGWLKVNMLSLADLVLILAEAYYNNVIRKNRTTTTEEEKDRIKERLENCHTQPNATPLIREVDLSYIENYLKTSSTIGENIRVLIETSLFSKLITKVHSISNDEMLSLLTLVWNENTEFSKLFYELTETYRTLNYEQEIFVEFKSVLREHGTLLDVARLDEMRCAPVNVTKEYIGEAQVRLSPTASPISVKKSFLSALIAELTFKMEQENDMEERKFLQYMDILDVPGYRPDDKYNEEDLYKGKSLTTVFRRGKVSYLFNKYSKTKRVSSLLFCHNHNQSNACVMGPVLIDWVENNVGVGPKEREIYVDALSDAPLFVISTWFNEDLKYMNQKKGDDLDEKWRRRFTQTMEGQVLRATDHPEHWFNHWTDKQKLFKNLFILRDFDYSKTTFSGYDKDLGTPESGIVPIEKYPTYLDDLKMSFMSNDFVRERFTNPEQSWNDAASVACDGTKPIIRKLNNIAPHIKDARNIMFNNILQTQTKLLLDILNSQYDPSDPTEQIKKAKKEAGKIIMSIDAHTGDNASFFASIIDQLMIPERMVYEHVFSKINTAEIDVPLSNKESEIYMNAGLDTKNSEETNLQLLCDFYGADNREELNQMLGEIGVNLGNLLRKEKQMMVSPAEQLVTYIEELWRKDFLGQQVIDILKKDFPPIDILLTNIGQVYDALKIHTILTNGVEQIMNTVIKNKQASIVGDYLAMSLNKFITSFGFAFMDVNQKEKLTDHSINMGMPVDRELVLDTKKTNGIDMLTRLDEVQTLLQKPGYNQDVRQLQKEVPQYRSRWQWQQRMRAAITQGSKMPRNGIEVNSKLKTLIDTIGSIQM